MTNWRSASSGYYVTLLKKGLRLRRFKSDRDEIWRDCSSKCALIGWLGFLIRHHTFKMMAMMTFQHSLLHLQQCPPAAH